MKSKGKRQISKGKSEIRKKAISDFLNQVPTFCLLPFEICLLIWREAF